MEAKLEKLKTSATALRTAVQAKSGRESPPPLGECADLIAAISAGARGQEKTVTPAAAGWTITADEGYDGLSRVTLAALPDLTPENIPFGITIGAVTGTAKVAVSEDAPEDFTSANPDLPDPGSAEAADATYRAIVGTAPPAEKFILADNNGNITYGYLEPGTVNTVQYNGVDLPDIQRFWDEESAIGAGYKNAHIFYSIKDGCYYLVCSVERAQRLENGSITAYDDKTGQFFYAALYKLSFNAETPEWTYDGRGGKLSSETWTERWGTLIWSSYDIYNANGTLYLGTTEPVRYFTGGFTITRYDPLTTEFAAKGWRRLSWHVDTQEWVYDDFTSVPSTGWNYLGNIRWCSRSRLMYRDLPVWPREAAVVESIAADMTQWTKNTPAQTAFTAITYEAATEENICQYTGVGMFELIGFTQKLTAGKTYVVAMDYATPTDVTGMYANPYAPYIGFFPVSCLSSDATPYETAYAARRLPAGAVTDYTTYVCTYTPSATMTVAIGFSPGSTEDGIPTEFRLRNINLWELPEVTA